MADKPKIEEIHDGNNQENPEVTDGADNAPSKDEVAKSTAKAGKRSAKAIKEAEELAAKEARKADHADEDAPAPKKEQPKTRSKLERRGKKYRDAQKLIEADKVYSLSEALELAAKTSPVKFDATVELHVRLGVDPRQADQNIRQSLVLPHGSGKTVRVAVFAEPDLHDAAKKAGADIVGTDEFLQLLDKEQLDFDVLIATPTLMARLGKYARLLGPKGLMPNPKSGTVTKAVGKAVEEAKAGRIEYRVDSTGIVHVGIGKVSFESAKLVANGETVMASIKAAKPASVKGNYLLSGYVTTTMGPSIPISL